jgi:hypothetical protein
VAFKAVQISLNSSTATALIVAGSGTTQFLNTGGTVTDPLPCIIRNTDAADTVYIGGPTVTAGEGFELLAGESMPFSLIAGDIPYAISATDTPVVAVLCGRQ